jgi:hypothetical protein
VAPSRALDAPSVGPAHGPSAIARSIALPVAIGRARVAAVDSGTVDVAPALLAHDPSVHAASMTALAVGSGPVDHARQVDVVSEAVDAPIALARDPSANGASMTVPRVSGRVDPVGAPEAVAVLTVVPGRGPSAIARSTAVPVTTDTVDGVDGASGVEDVPAAARVSARLDRAVQVGVASHAEARIEAGSGVVNARTVVARSRSMTARPATLVRLPFLPPTPDRRALLPSAQGDVPTVVPGPGRSGIARSAGIVDLALRGVAQPDAARARTAGSATLAPVPRVAAASLVVVVGSRGAAGHARSATPAPLVAAASPAVLAGSRGAVGHARSATAALAASPAVAVGSRGAAGHARSATPAPPVAAASRAVLAGSRGTVGHARSVTAAPPVVAASPAVVVGSRRGVLAAGRGPAGVASAADVAAAQGREARVTRPAGHRSPDSPAAARASALPRVAADSAPCRAGAQAANHGREGPAMRVEVGEAAVGAEPAPASPG